MELRLLVKMIAAIDDVKTTFFVCAFAQEASTFRVPLTAGSITSACHVHKFSMPLEDTNPHDHPPFIFLSILVPIYCFFQIPEQYLLNFMEVNICCSFWAKSKGGSVECLDYPLFWIEAK